MPAPIARKHAVTMEKSQFIIAMPTIVAQNPRTEPTDRSIPPTTSTSVMPTVTTVNAGNWLRIVLRVTSEKKLSAARPKKTISRSREAKIKFSFTSDLIRLEFSCCNPGNNAWPYLL